MSNDKDYICAVEFLRLVNVRIRCCEPQLFKFVKISCDCDSCFSVHLSPCLETLSRAILLLAEEMVLACPAKIVVCKKIETHTTRGAQVGIMDGRKAVHKASGRARNMSRSHHVTDASCILVLKRFCKAQYSEGSTMASTVLSRNGAS